MKKIKKNGNYWSVEENGETVYQGPNEEACKEYIRKEAVTFFRAKKLGAMMDPLTGLMWHEGRRNKAIIFKVVDMYHVQIWTLVDWQYDYFGNSKLCRTINDVRNFCEKCNVPENRREWRF